jgi:AcrR family transcriptional regulator
VYSELSVRSASITSTARDSIVEEAIRLFGSSGIELTSLREVARAANVSPALVVHHFGGKAGLVAAVDKAALEQFGSAYSSDPAGGIDLLRQRAEQTGRVMRERPDICAYLGRALVEGTPGSTHLFRLMMAGGRAEIDALAEKGALREDVDRLWATLQHLFLIWAPLSFMSLLEQEVVGGSILEGENLESWVDANVDLLERGIYR